LTAKRSQNTGPKARSTSKDVKPKIQAQTSNSTASGRRSKTKTLASHGLDPLPSIDPANVRTKEFKHPIAAALQSGSEKKMDILKENSTWRQKFEDTKYNEAKQKEIDAKTELKSELDWSREKYHLDRKEAKENAAAEAIIRERQERNQLAKDLALSGKTPAEVLDYLNIVFPPKEKDSKEKTGIKTSPKEPNSQGLPYVSITR
jgi:hypothetical protein